MVEKGKIYCIHKTGKKRKVCSPDSCDLYSIVQIVNGKLRDEFNRLALKRAVEPNVLKLEPVSTMSDWINGDLPAGDKEHVDREIDKVLEAAGRNRSECVFISKKKRT